MMRQSEIIIRQAKENDKEDIYKIARDVLKTGDTYTLSPNSKKDEILSYWFGQNKSTYVALLNNKIVGFFYIKPNQAELGNHIANASYMVAPKFQNKGIGRKMCEYSLSKAKEIGYKAMQFNFVVKSNVSAVKLWQKLGFRIIGEIPKAFRHSTNGLVNAYIMFKELN